MKLTYILRKELSTMKKILTLMLVNGVAAHCDSVSTITIGEVEITPPADADSYQLVDIT